MMLSISPESFPQIGHIGPSIVYVNESGVMPPLDEALVRFVGARAGALAAASSQLGTHRREIE